MSEPLSNVLEDPDVKIMVKILGVIELGKSHE